MVFLRGGVIASVLVAAMSWSGCYATTKAQRNWSQAPSCPRPSRALAALDLVGTVGLVALAANFSNLPIDPMCSSEAVDCFLSENDRNGFVAFSVIGAVSMAASAAYGFVDNACEPRTEAVDEVDRAANAERARRRHAQRTLARECERGHGDSCHSMALRLLREDGDAREIDGVLAQGCAHASTSACVLLGRRVSDEDPDLAEKYFQRACTLGDSKGCAGVRTLMDAREDTEEGDAVPSEAAPPDRRDEDPSAETVVSTGTCFAASPDGLVVTAHHVLKGAKMVRVQFGGEEMLSAELVQSSSTLDVAVLRVARRTKSYLDVRDADSVALGSTVFTIGFPVPKTLGWEPKYQDGTISALSAFGDPTMLQLSVNAYPGNSGGALVTHDGRLIGVIVSRFNDKTFIEETGTIAGGISFAVKASFVAPLLPKRAHRARRVRREAAIKLAETATCRVLAATVREEDLRSK